MGKVVKLCIRCDEGFAEKFDHCPNCGTGLQAFRLEQIDRPTSVVPRLPETTTGFGVTVIEPQNVAALNALFAGSLVFMVTALIVGMVVNLFSKDLDVGSINDDIFNAVIVDDIAEPIEKGPDAIKDKNKGGGGGGGNHDTEPASAGDRAPMRTDPQFAPSVSMERLTQPTIPIQMAIKGPINERIDTSRYGVKLGGDTPSDGPGSNFGQGPGRDGGQGPGIGPGAGPGEKGGFGGGPHGSLPRANPDDPDGPPPVGGVTTALKILSKPRPSFTDTARQSGVQGEVVLRVSFLSNGTIGSISVVRGLPDGLTEQAVQAARRITFEPARVNGRPQTVSRQIEYSFYIY